MDAEVGSVLPREPTADAEVAAEELPQAQVVLAVKVAMEQLGLFLDFPTPVAVVVAEPGATHQMFH